MASIFQDARFNPLVAIIASAPTNTLERYSKIYEEHRDRVYSLAFYMTDSEIEAEELSRLTFCRAFARNTEASAEVIDQALLAELRELMPVGSLTLEILAPGGTMARSNVKRVVLERAVVQLPATERLVFLLHDVENYAHERIANLLGITESESRQALHAARLNVRQWVATHDE